MTPDEITDAAVRYVRSEYDSATETRPAPVLPTIDEYSPIVAVTLARWATFGDPAPVPPGWTLDTWYTTATGIHQLASPPAGSLYHDAPVRRIPWTCRAGITHYRYWRSHHRPNRAPLAACEHQPDPAPLHEEAGR